MMRSLLLAALLIAVAVTLATALVIRDGVGSLEYVVGAALLALLLIALFRVSRGVVRRA